MKKRIIRERQMFDVNSLIPIIRKVIVAFLSALFGFAINWVFDGKTTEGIVMLTILGILCVSVWIATCIFESKTNILAILQKDLKNGRYQEVVKLGCAVSRAMFLAGKNRERCLISDKVILALEEIERENITTIDVNEKPEEVILLKSKITIDDYGWSLYLCDTFKNRLSAENKIKEGIKDCLRYTVANADEDKKNKAYGILFKGIRHLFAMCIENFEATPVMEFQKNTGMLPKYKNEIINIGGFLGWLLEDNTMYSNISTEHNKKYIIDLFPEIGLTKDAFIVQFQLWAKDEMKKTKFALSTYNFRVKYFLAMAKICELENLDKSIKEVYLNNAKRLALLMTVGYSPSESDLNWIENTFTFGKEIFSLIKDGGYVKSKDSERFVKGYVLLGTVAAAFEDQAFLDEAKKAFKKAVEESKRVNRIDTYLRAQRKIISTNEKIFLYKYNKQIIPCSDMRDELENLQKEMVKILSETKQFLGYPDKKMVESCKNRKKKYKKIMQLLKENENGGITRYF